MTELSMNLPTIEETVASVSLSETDRTTLVRALVAREDVLADMLRMAGMRFGLYPQIVAEVFAEVGIGTPVPDEQRAMIRAQFTALMEELQRQYGAGEQ